MNTKPTIGIDVRVLGTHQALDRYTRNLITALLSTSQRYQYLLFTDEVSKISEWKKEVGYYSLPPKKVLTDHLRFGRMIRNAQVDLVFHPDNTEFFNCVPVSVVTLHDVIPWKFSELILSVNPLLRARQQLYFKLQEAALRKAAQIITVSEVSKGDINQILHIPEEKITVIHEGIEDKFRHPVPRSVLKKFNIKGDYLFYVGGFSPHKNVLSLVKALALLENKELMLVLGGKTDETKGGQSAFREIMTEIFKNNLKQRVLFTGLISEEELTGLYQHAKIFVYPSLYEGFGFPPLEAMKAGVPVISSNRGSLAEVAGKGSLQIDTANPALITQAILEVLNDRKLAGELVRRGTKLVDQYTWEKTAEQTIKVFEALVQ